MDLTVEDFALEVAYARQRVRGGLQMSPPSTPEEAAAWYKHLAENALAELTQLADTGRQFIKP